jgi:Pyruvate/2-oxoacid:ferredoxin oxidoreductase delta subunit
LGKTERTVNRPSEERRGEGRKGKRTKWFILRPDSLEKEVMKCVTCPRKIFVVQKKFIF